MKVFVLYDPDDYTEVKVYQSQENLYKDLIEEIERYDTELGESARLLFDKGDYEDILHVYEEFSGDMLSVIERTVIK